MRTCFRCPRPLSSRASYRPRFRRRGRRSTRRRSRRETSAKPSQILDDPHDRCGGCFQRSLSAPHAKSMAHTSTHLTSAFMYLRIQNFKNFKASHLHVNLVRTCPHLLIHTSVVSSYLSVGVTHPDVTPMTPGAKDDEREAAGAAVGVRPERGAAAQLPDLRKGHRDGDGDGRGTAGWRQGRVERGPAGATVGRRSGESWSARRDTHTSRGKRDLIQAVCQNAHFLFKLGHFTHSSCVGDNEGCLLPICLRIMKPTTFCPHRGADRNAKIYKCVNARITC